MLRKAVTYWFTHPWCNLAAVALTFIGTLIAGAIGMVILLVTLTLFAVYDMNKVT